MSLLPYSRRWCTLSLIFMQRVRDSPSTLGSSVTRLGLGTTSRFRLLTQHRSGVRISSLSLQIICDIHCTKFEPFLKAILMIRTTERKRTRFCENNLLGKGFRKTSATNFEIRRGLGFARRRGLGRNAGF